MRKQLVLLCVALLSACARAPHPAATPAERRIVPPLRVMSFNIRYNNPGDGPNAWPLRKAWVAQLIRFHDADAVGVQEALPGMLADLDTLLPEYARIGVGRTDGIAKGEFSAILYRRERLEMLENATFWLSPNPEVVGSKAWDAALERIATWGRFRDRATGCTYLHLNTHFDHVGERARQESARIIRLRLATLAAASPVVVTGDLNTDPRSVAYRILTRDTISARGCEVGEPRGPLRPRSVLQQLPRDSFRWESHRLRAHVAGRRGAEARHPSRQLGQSLPVGPFAGSRSPRHSLPLNATEHPLPSAGQDMGRVGRSPTRAVS
jgi:endonuclease/exonuclease/phosphatase family metal-dependent hydrolase